MPLELESDYETDMEDIGNPDAYPADAWQTDLSSYIFVWLDTSQTACTNCNRAPDLARAWKEIPASSDAAAIFTDRASNHLLDAGWRLPECFLWCPECFAKR